MLNLKANAKINLTLDVIGRRDDGYHDMVTIMQGTTLSDDIFIDISDGGGKVSVETDKVYLPNGEKNIAGKAARVYLDSFGINNKDVSIKIIKQIPVCAGLGGGSADAAAVIVGLEEYFNMPLSDRINTADTIGSDVPFCFFNGTMLARGRGEVLENLPALPDCAIVLCKPAFSISTPKLFGKLDEQKIKCRPDTDGMIRALEAGDFSGVAHRCFNVFESVLPSAHRQTVEHIKDVMLSGGAGGAAMSGTGSAVFGIYFDKDKALDSAELLKREYKECFIAKPL